MSPELVHGCRNMVPQQLGSYLGQSGRAPTHPEASRGNAIGKAARDLQQTVERRDFAVTRQP